MRAAQAVARAWQGYYKAHAADADFGADYATVEELLAEHRRNKEMKNGDDQ